MPGKARVSGWREGCERRRSLRISGLKATRSQEIMGDADDHKGKKKHHDVSGSSSEEDYAFPHTQGGVGVGVGVDVADLEAAADMTLPEKTVLELVLDTLQRRDTCEIFGEPLDPQKFEDYYRIIQEPMDFGTMRAKLHEGMYTCLQQFQYDVFLITRNAMRFNPWWGTTFFKQAHGIDELAKKVFHLLKSSNPEDFEKQLLEETTRKPPIRRSSRAAATTRGSANNRRSIPASGNTPRSSACESSKAALFSSRLPSCRSRSAAKSSNLQAAAAGNTNGQRSTYSHRISLRNEGASLSFATCPSNIQEALQQQVQVKEEQEIGYQDSLTQFVKNLGPTAKKFARIKLLALGSTPNPPPCQQPSSSRRMNKPILTLSSTTQLWQSPIINIIAESTPTTAAAAPIRDHHHHAEQFHSRVIVLALPCDTTRKKPTTTTTTTSCHRHNPGICIAKKRAAAPLQDSCFNNNISSYHMLPLPLGGSRTEVSQACNISSFMQTKVGGGTDSSLKPSCAAAAPLPTAPPQFKFNLQFLQTRLDQMKKFERPTPPVPLMQQPCASLLGSQSNNNNNNNNNNNLQEESVEIYGADLSLRL